jgi:two-component system chemotaxis sensor kinase CheA
MAVEDDEIMREFLIESRENLLSLDRDFVALEQNPRDHALLSRIFRCVHTIKGTSGFLNLPSLEKLTHIGETQLSRLRDGEILLDTQATSALLAMVDGVRRILTSLETTSSEGNEDFTAIIGELAKIGQKQARVSAVPPPAPAAVVAKASARPSLPPPIVVPAPVATPAPVAPPVRPAATARASSDAPTPAAAAAPPSHAPAPSARPAKVEKLAPHPSARPPAPAAPAPAAAAQNEHVAETAIRVDVALLDRVMNLVGELVLARNQILQYGAKSNDPGLVNASQRLNLLTTEIQAGVMKTRMQPIGSVWTRIPRVVRDLANVCGKSVNVELEGSGTELDRSIIEAIKDPLMHAVRNAIDHGIESPEKRLAAGKPAAGKLTFRAFHEGGQVNIEVSDDGGGINTDKCRARAVERGLVAHERALRMNERELLHLIFLPGFSTAESVTHLSGRGVGMDVVKTNIEQIGGTVDISSERGVGTTLRIKIPLTLAIIPALIITSGGERFAIPQVNLLELVRLEGAQSRRGIETLHGTPLYRLRGNLLPLVFLNETLDLPGPGAGVDAINIVVLQADDRQFGLVVDGISDTEEIVVKPLGKELKKLDTFAGATIMGDGKVALILDVLGVARHAGVVSGARERGVLDALESKAADTEPRQALLLFRAGGADRMAIPLSLVARLEELAPERVERAGGREVVQYRGSILPLIRLDEDRPNGRRALYEGPLKVIVYAEHGRSVGLVVDEILDVVEEVVRVEEAAAGHGLCGMAVIQGKVTDLLDVHAAIRRHDPNFFERKGAAA